MVSTRSASKSGAAAQPRASSPGVTSRRQPAAASRSGGARAAAAAQKPETRRRTPRKRLSAVDEEAGGAENATLKEPTTEAAPADSRASADTGATEDSSRGSHESAAGHSADSSGGELRSTRSAREAGRQAAADAKARRQAGEEGSSGDSRPTGIGVLSPAARQPAGAASGADDSGSEDSEDEADPLGSLAASMWRALQAQRLGGASAGLHASASAAETAADELTWRPAAPLPAPLTAAERAGGEAQAEPGERALNKQLLAPPRDRKHAAQQRKAQQPRDWHELPETPLTDELKRDLRLLRLRGAMDPKRFYKKGERGRFPTRFAVGAVVEDAADFYTGRLTNKQRKQTLTEEVLADAEAGQSRKRRFAALQEERGRWAQRRHKGRKEQLKRKPKRPKH